MTDLRAQVLAAIEGAFDYDAPTFDAEADAVMAVLRLPENAPAVRSLATHVSFASCPHCDAGGLGANALEKHIERRHPAALTAEEAT